MIYIYGRQKIFFNNYIKQKQIMKKLLIFSMLLICAFNLNVLGQDPKQEFKRIYGGVPTSNSNMNWQDSLTPNEKYVGVIQIDSTIKASSIIEAFMITFQPLQDANIMTKQMRTINTMGAISSSLNGDYKSANDFSKAGKADARDQNKNQSAWTVQFIDGVRTSRFYYNISVQAKDGRYKLTVIPAGLSGYGLDHIQTEWSQMFRDGKVKSLYSNYYEQMKIKLAYTIDQWINEVNKQLKEKSDW